MPDIIYLEPDDEITLVIDRLRSSRSERIALVLPRGSTLAQSIVNLKILKRSAEEIGKEISLVTSDRIAGNLASQIEMPVFSKVSEASAAKPKPAVPPPVEAQDPEPPAFGFRVNTYAKSEAALPAEKREGPLETEDQEMVSARTLPPDFSGDSAPAAPAAREQVKTKTFAAAPMTKRKKSRIPVVFIVFLLICGLSAAYLFLPSASAALELKTSDYDTELEVKVDRAGKAVDTALLVLPGQVFEAQKEAVKSFPATGKREAGEKARGKITVSNNYDSNSHKYAKGLRLTASGKVFTADEAFTVGGATVSLAAVKAGEGTVNVTAESAGESYNLPASVFVLEGAPVSIAGRGETAGGTTRELHIVTEKDLSDAESALKSELEESGKKEIKDEAAKTGGILIESAVVAETVSGSKNKSADEEAENFDYTLKVKVFGIGFLERDLRSLLAAAVGEKIGKDKMLVNPEKSEIQFVVSESNRDLNIVKLRATFKGKVAEKLLEPEIKNAIRNKSLSQAEKILAEKKEISGVKITVWPDFLNRLPILVNRIGVVFNYGK